MPIWIVVVDGEPYVRSVRGSAGRWYRELLAGQHGTLVVQGRRVTVRPARVRSAALVARASEAFREKYRASGSLASMLRREILDTTLRLEAATA